MRHAIRLVTMAVCAVAVPVIAASESDASGGGRERQVRKHHQRPHLGWNNSLRRSWAADEIRPVAPSWSGGGEVCAGNARGIDCKIWPPPIGDDPDRKASSDGM